MFKLNHLYCRLGVSLSVADDAVGSVAASVASVSLSAGPAVDEAPPVKLFKCPQCEWSGATVGVVKTHIKKKHL